MFGCYDRINVVLALDAVIKAGQQTVGIRRKVHADNICFFVGDVIQESRILVGKSVVVLLPYIGGQDKVQRCDRLSPGKLIADFQPFCMLCCHGIHDTDKRFVACKESMTSGQKISFQPSLAHMLAQHTVHDTAVSCQAVVGRQKLCVPVTVRRLKSTVQTVGHRLIRSENTEILALLVQTEDVTHISAQLDHILCFRFSGFHLDSVITEIRQTKIFQQQTAVCMRVRAHTRISLRSQLCDFRFQTSVLVKQFFRMVTFHPLFQLLQMFRFLHRDRNLMCTEASFDLLSVHNLRSGPSLRSTQNDHRPYRSLRIIILSCILLDRFDLLDHDIHGLRHLTVHGHRIIAFYEIRFPATALEESFHLFVRDTGEQRRVADLISVQMQDRKNRTVADWIQEFIGMPGCCQRACLRLTVTNNCHSDQIRVIEYSAECMGDRISKFTTFIDGTRRLRCTVARNSAREGELFEHLSHSFGILADVRIYFTVRTFQVCIGNLEVSAMSRT